MFLTITYIDKIAPLNYTPSMENVETVAESLEPQQIAVQLAAYEQTRPEIAAVYLFGSQAKGTARASSDVDVGLLLADDFDLHRNYKYRLEQMMALATLLHKPVDVVILNRAPLVLRHQVLKYGRCVYEGNHQVRVSFEVQSRKAYFDFKPYLAYHHQKLTARIREGNLAYQYRGHQDPLDDARRAFKRLEGTPNDAL